MNRLKNATLESILDAVEAATAPEDLPILEEIGEQIGHYHGWYDSRPPRVLVNGETVTETHGFAEWLMLLQAGAGALPERLPRRFLEAWRDAYDPKWGLDGSPWCPHPVWRCMDCAIILPHCPGWADPCPVCGGSRIWHADLSKPFGANWINPHPVRRGADAD